jgi:aminomethyltransferase
MPDLRKTPLHPAHIAAHGKLVAFAGYELPVQYTSMLAEHRAVRERAGLFDVSHLGKIDVGGPGALEALQGLVTNDLSRAADGQAMYTAICTEAGGIVDDVVVYRRSVTDFLVCVNASNREKDVAWFEDHLEHAEQRDASDDYAQLALQGPRAAAILAKLTPLDLTKIGTYRFESGEVAGRKMLVARTGYTGEDGFELFCRPEEAVPLWNALLEAGQLEGLMPAGLGARDSLRTEMKYCLYGNDIDETTNPLEAGIGWAVKLDKPGGFIGAEALRVFEKEPWRLYRKLVGFKLEERAIPRHGNPVVVMDYDSRTWNPSRRPEACVQDATVTSGTLSPTLDVPIGMAYVPDNFSAPGTGTRDPNDRYVSVSVVIRGRDVPAVIVETPFYKRKRT